MIYKMDLINYDHPQIIEINAAFNDEEVLKFNKYLWTARTRKMTECADYPQADLAEFYEMLAQDENGVVDHWNTKSLQLWDDLHERKFYVGRKK